MRLISLMILTMGFSPLVLAQVLNEPMSTLVEGGTSTGKEMQCKAYLSKPTQKNQKPAKLLFYQPGTGVYTTYFNHLKSQDYYQLSIDKPGVTPDSQNPEKPIVDRKLYDYYTTKTLITCAQNALYWAYDKLKDAKPKIILGGHSEGTVVMVNLVNNVYSDKEKKHLQDNIKALFLSGVVIQNPSEVIEFQFKSDELKKLMRAYKKHDDDFIYENYQVGWYWFDDDFKSGEKLLRLKDLAKTQKGRNLPIQIFQGLSDEAVSAKAVQKFEVNNDESPEDSRLNVRARYYNAGHQMNPTAVFDIGVLHDYYFNLK